MKLKVPKTFFGWSNLKWLCREFMAMYSNTNSYFSKKRVESSVAFISATVLILWHAYYSRVTITNSEILADAALLFTIAGYTLNQIQKEKKNDIVTKTTDTTIDSTTDSTTTTTTESTNMETDSK